ncbi:collectin-12-like [Mytilus trossulus]|uniref:collectin-12-like n=1 Tax=Mytilus trossulus TaxID=6551 RepID=UPI00300484E4
MKQMLKNYFCFIVTGFITFIPTRIDGDFNKMTERKELRNKHLQGNLVKSMTTETNIECFRQCTKLTQCSAMSYNKQNKICYMYSRLNTYSDVTAEDGRMYYLKDVNNCLTEEGYSYKSSVMLCIKFYNVKVIYHDAVSTCQSQNTSLVKIDSQEKQNVLYSYLVVDEQFNAGHIYLQGNRVPNTSEWVFDDGTPITYLPWNLGQPEAYDQMYLCALAQDKGMWHDCVGTQLFGFVCERNLF